MVNETFSLGHGTRGLVGESNILPIEMGIEDRTPLHVAKSRGPLSGIDDIREENSGQNAVRLDWLLRSIHEVANFG